MNYNYDTITKYAFPALFGHYEDGHISVVFPDLPGCVSCGYSFEEAVKMAREALYGHLLCMREDDDIIPSPSPTAKINPQEHQAIVIIYAAVPTLEEMLCDAI